MSPLTCATPQTSAAASIRDTPARAPRGQASLELVALLPLLLISAALLVQGIFLGSATLVARYEAYRAAHAQQPARLGPFRIIHTRETASATSVQVQVQVPQIVPGLGPAKVRASARRMP